MESTLENLNGMLLSGNPDDSYGKTSDPLEGPVTKVRKAHYMLKFFLIVTALSCAGFSAWAYREYKTALADGTFFYGTRINGADSAGLTPAQVNDRLREEHGHYEFAMTFRDGTRLSMDGKEFGYSYLTGNVVENLQKSQTFRTFLLGYWEKLLAERDFLRKMDAANFPAAKILRKSQWVEKYRNWAASLHEKYAGLKKKEQDFTVGGVTQFDREILREKLFRITADMEKRAVAPQDAYLDYIDGEFAIVPETAGNKLKAEAFVSRVMEAVERGETEVAADVPELYFEASLKKDNNQLVQEQDTLNNLAKVNIVYELPDSRIQVLDGRTVRNWLSVDNDGNRYVAENEIRDYIEEYVDGLASELNNVGVDRSFVSTLQGEIKVGGGTYGRQLNKTAEIKQLTEEILNKKTVKREPVYLVKEVADENNGIGNTYIEIDLTHQKLWYYINGELFLDTPLVSGTANVKSRRTPGGIYTMYYKERNRVLRGQRRPDGTYEYESPVTYWMPFNGGIGLHDASWRGRFGGSIYLTSGSHGCINLPRAKAEAIFNVIDKNVPIVVFY